MTLGKRCFAEGREVGAMEIMTLAGESCNLFHGLGVVNGMTATPFKRYPRRRFYFIQIGNHAQRESDLDERSKQQSALSSDSIPLSLPLRTQVERLLP